MKMGLTVDDLIAALSELSKQGKGNAQVTVIPASAPVTGVYGPIGVSNSEEDAVLLYAK